MTQEQWRGGLSADQDLVLPDVPENPALLESSNFWIFADDGSFALPRVDVEAIGERWSNPSVQLNAATADGRVFFDPQGQYSRIAPLAADGTPRILGSGPLRTEVLEPFHKWRVTYDGEVMETTIDALVESSINLAAGDNSHLARTALQVDLELEMAVPCFVQNNPEDKLKDMTEREQADAKAMGIGWRLEQLFRGKGSYTLDGATRPITCTGLRIHRQSFRPLGGFRGHCWQSALFPDGRGFGYCTYPPAEDGSTFNEGYVYVDGRYYPATAKSIPWYVERIAEGEDVSVELESELGTTRITASSKFNTFKQFVFGPGTFNFNQGGAQYEWDGQTADGMMERSFFTAAS